LVDFVEEVEDQLRAERYQQFARQYLPWFFAALAALIIGWLGVWAYDAYQAKRVGAASIAYNKALESLATGDQLAADKAFGDIAKDGPTGYRTLALMQQANIQLASDKSDAAVALFDAAAKIAPNGILKDLAGLRAAQVVMDSAPYAQMETRLKALIGDKRPFSLEAREMLAMAKLQAGKAQEARGDFSAISLTLGVSPAMRARAQGAMALIDGGQAALVGQVVKAAAALPPQTGPAAGGFGAQPPPGAAPAPDAAGSDADQTPAGNAQ